MSVINNTSATYVDQRVCHIKLQAGNETTRFQCTTFKTFQELLVAQLQRNKQSTDLKAYTMKWRDEDNDWISLNSWEDWIEAKRSRKVAVLYIVVTRAQNWPSQMYQKSVQEVKEVVREVKPFANHVKSSICDSAKLGKAVIQVYGQDAYADLKDLVKSGRKEVDPLIAKVQSVIDQGVTDVINFINQSQPEHTQQETISSEERRASELIKREEAKMRAQKEAMMRAEALAKMKADEEAMAKIKEEQLAERKKLEEEAKMRAEERKRLEEEEKKRKIGSSGIDF